MAVDTHLRFRSRWIGFGVTVPLCPAGGSTNLSNLSFSAQALLEGLAGEATVQVLSLMFFAP